MNQQEIRDAIEWLTVRRNVHEAYTNANPSTGTHYYDLAIAALKEQIDPGWIKVSERIPRKKDADRRGNVLVYGERTKSAYTWGWNALLPAHTHWMPLPEPPKDGED